MERWIIQPQFRIWCHMRKRFRKNLMITGNPYFTGYIQQHDLSDRFYLMVRSFPVALYLTCSTGHGRASPSARWGAPSHWWAAGWSVWRGCCSPPRSGPLCRTWTYGNPPYNLGRNYPQEISIFLLSYTYRVGSMRSLRSWFVINRPLCGPRNRTLNYFEFRLEFTEIFEQKRISGVRYTTDAESVVPETLLIRY